MKAILIKNDFVQNIIVWDETCISPEDAEVVLVEDDFQVSIGWIYKNNSFFDPNPPTVIEQAPQLTLSDLQNQIAELSAKIQSMQQSA